MRITVRLFLVLLLLLSPLGSTRANAAPAVPRPARGVPAIRRHSIPDLMAQVSPDQLRHHLCKLQDDDRGSYCNPQGSRYAFNARGQQEARTYIYQTLAGLGLGVVYDPFQQSGQTLYNVVATKPGRDAQSSLVYILCAHYDSTSPDAPADGPAPGADDNGTGVAALLETARVLSSETFSYTMRFIAFSAEEQGMWGSVHYAAQAAAAGQNIAGVINLDMIGYDSNGDRIMEVHAGTDPDSIALADAFIANISQYGLNLQPLKYTSNATRYSDHAPFWDHGYPAFLGIESYRSGDFNPHYHETTDTLDHVTLSYVTDFTKAAVATLASLARPPKLPKTVRVAPRRGWCRPGSLQYLTSVFRDADGSQDLHYVELLVNTTFTDTVRPLCTRYDRQSNLMFLQHPTEGYWMPAGGAQPGSVRVIRTGYAHLDLSRSRVIENADTITVTWAVTFTYRMSGQAYNLYLRAEDLNGAVDGWNDHGDRTINRQPVLLTPTPLNQTLYVGQPYLFVTRYMDRDGWDGFQEVYLLITNTLPATVTNVVPVPPYRYRDAVYLKYNQRENRFYLRNREDTAWLPAGGFAPRQPIVVQNALCALSGEWTRWGRYDAKTLTTKWYLRFKLTFRGRQRVYMRAVDEFGVACGGDTGWRVKGWVEIR